MDGYRISPAAVGARTCLHKLEEHGEFELAPYVVVDPERLRTIMPERLF